jgi:hypothetical protein
MYKPIDGAKPYKHSRVESSQARFVAVVIRAMPDDIKHQPIAHGYCSAADLADMLDYYVDLEALECERRDRGTLTLDCAAYMQVSDYWGASCFYVSHFAGRHLLPPNKAFDGLMDAFLAKSQAVKWLATLGFNSTNELTEKLPWEIREQWRMWRLYSRIKWELDGKLAPIPGHFAHISRNDPTKVAFTENAAKGERDIQLTMRPGRYIKRFYPHLSDERIAEIVGDMGREASEYDLLFAKTADEIQEVYENGPNSCMSKDASEYAGHCHPVRVYGESDLELAYLKLKKTEQITARALVWPEKRKIGRIYGDELRLENMLLGLGYEKRKCSAGRDLSGARFRTIVNKNGDGLIMPYIDGTNQYRQIDKDWCVIADRGSSGCYTHGLDGEYSEDDYTCEQCDEGCSEDDAYTVITSRRSEQLWCSHCRDSHASYCEHNREYVANDSIREVLVLSRGSRQIQSWSEWACEDDAYFCDHLEEWVSDDVERYDMHNGETWSKFAFDEDGVEIDGVYYSKDDAPTDPDIPTTEAEAWNVYHGPHDKLKPWGLDWATKHWIEYWASVEKDRKNEIARALAEPAPALTIE